MFNQKDQSPYHTPQILLSLLLLSSLQWGNNDGGGRTSFWYSSTAGADPLALAVKEAPSVDIRAFANKPGQKGSTFTPAVLMGPLILSSIIGTSYADGLRDQAMELASAG